MAITLNKWKMRKRRTERNQLKRRHKKIGDMHHLFYHLAFQGDTANCRFWHCVHAYLTSNKSPDLQKNKQPSITWHHVFQNIKSCFRFNHTNSSRILIAVTHYSMRRSVNLISTRWWLFYTACPIISHPVCCRFINSLVVKNTDCDVEHIFKI